MVAVATESLCEAANLTVQGKASEEKLIASANSVASSTVQLLLACRVKSDAESKSQKNLQVFFMNLSHDWKTALMNKMLTVH